MNNLILIPARGGSARVEDKNIRDLADRPLVTHVIENALNSQTGRVVVSTNSGEIADVSRRYGAEVPFLRPEALSTANAASLWAILHAINWFRDHENWTPDMIAFCPPTNPFLKPETIKSMFQVLSKSPHIDSVVAVTKPKTHPFRIVRLREDGTIENGIISLEGKTIGDIERSQDWPEVLEGSPACRITKTSYFLDLLDSTDDPYSLSGKTYNVESCIGYQVGSFESIDIDDEEDFAVAEALYKMTRQG